METHYTKHHAAYTKNLNEAAEGRRSGPGDRSLSPRLTAFPTKPAHGIRNNGGGFYTTTSTLIR
jgi:Fe-Mn family superoxide dismutase